MSEIQHLIDAAVAEVVEAEFKKPSLCPFCGAMAPWEHECDLSRTEFKGILNVNETKKHSRECESCNGTGFVAMGDDEDNCPCVDPNTSYWARAGSTGPCTPCQGATEWESQDDE